MEQATSDLQVLDDLPQLPLDELDADTVASIVDRILASDQHGATIDVARFSSSI